MQMVGWLGDDQFDALDQTVKDKMAAAMAFAKASPEPDKAEAITDVYAPSKTTAADVAAEAKLRERCATPWTCGRSPTPTRWLRRLARR